MLFQTTDESVLDGKGRVVYFSLRRFISDIVQGENCFICGASPDDVAFNNEHILPDWILRRYKLHSRNITLTNGTQFMYGRFTVPCCAECNGAMGARVEEPIRSMFNKGYKGFCEQLRQEGSWPLFCWMSLVFLKTHLKDINLRFHQDRRKGEQKIGELHSWGDLHHIHCIARAFYTECELKKEVLGSLVVLPAKMLPYGDKFDFCDLSVAQTMLIRLDDVGIIAVFDDSQASLSFCEEDLNRISGPLSPLQLREVAIRIAAINIHLAERPMFRSELDFVTEAYSIGAKRPLFNRLENWKDEVVGKMLQHICANMIVNTSEREQILENLKSGRYSFLFNSEGEFAADHMDLVPQVTPNNKTK